MSIFSSWIKLLQLFLGIVQHHVAGGYGAFSQHRCVLSRLLQSLSWAKAGTPCPTHITPLQIPSTILAQQQGMHMNHRTTKFPRPPSHWNFPLISVAGTLWGTHCSKFKLVLSQALQNNLLLALRKLYCQRRGFWIIHKILLQLSFLLI